jgi:hypothetical protein
MKVKELIANLQKIDQELDVFCYCENKDNVGDLTKEFSIQNISVSDVEIERESVGRVNIKYIKSKKSIKVAFLEITTDM